MRRAGATLLALSALLASSCDDDDRDGHHARSDATIDVALAAAVRVEAEGCRSKASIGAGSFVGEEQVLTVAHVVAGSDEVSVILADGSRVTAIVTAIDRDKDLAVLHVESDTTPLPRATMRPGARGTFIIYRDDEPLASPFEAISFVDIDMPSIDHDGSSSLRRGYQIEATVAKGDSGAVLVSNGVATAMVFARSTATEAKAWAVDITEADALLAGADESPVDVGECT